MRDYTHRMEWLTKFKDEGVEVTHQEILDSYLEEE